MIRDETKCVHEKNEIQLDGKDLCEKEGLGKLKN